MGQLSGTTNDVYGERLDTRGRGVGFFLGLVEGGQANIHDAKRVQARVRGPQPGERLPHTSYGVLHRPRADWSAAGVERARSVAVSKEL